MITVQINQKPHNFPQSLSIGEMLMNLDLVQEGIAVAVNQHIITRSEWADRVLKDDDEVLIIKATQGG